MTGQGQEPQQTTCRSGTADEASNHKIFTVLLDMSTFYDTIDLQLLQQTAQDLSYPPLALEFAMQVYTGPKAILAEAELSIWFHVTRGVAASCPQAPLLAKTFLQPILTTFQNNYQDFHLNGWVDDIGFDGSHDAPSTPARTESSRASCQQPKNCLYCHRQNHPQGAGQAARPPLRDLGIDHTAGRIATLQQRFKKNRQRRIKLRTLKLPNLRTRLRLHKGGVQPVAFWGFEGQGLAQVPAGATTISCSPPRPTPGRPPRCHIRPGQPEICGSR